MCTQTCEYVGETTSSGLDAAAPSPSQDQMMDSKVMDAYWAKFADNCKAAEGSQNTRLQWVELGNWMEVRGWLKVR